jgi:hypothetical protein
MTYGVINLIYTKSRPEKITSCLPPVAKWTSFSVFSVELRAGNESLLQQAPDVFPPQYVASSVHKYYSISGAGRGR